MRRPFFPRLNTLPLLISISIATAASATDPAPPKAAKLLDAGHVALLCKAWNQSALPKALGRSGSGWIDSAGSKGKQTMVIGRRDCTGFKKVALTIEATASGDASCTASGVHKAGAAFQWKFEPTTAQWADFSDGFGVFKMPGIMDGFVGPYPTAMNNISNFGVFFALAGKSALDSGVSWTCEGGDASKIADEVKSIDKAEMAQIAAGE